MRSDLKNNERAHTHANGLTHNVLELFSLKKAFLKNKKVPKKEKFQLKLNENQVQQQQVINYTLAVDFVCRHQVEPCM